MTGFDRRITPARPDLAAARLRGTIPAARYVEGRRMRVIASVTPMRPEPVSDAGIDTELLHGEAVEVYDVTDEGWAWVQAEGDGYVGWVSDDALSDASREPTHVVALLRCFVFPGPSIKLPALRWLPFGAGVVVTDVQGDFAVLADGGFVYAPALRLRGETVADPVSVSEAFLGTPYLWGGRSSLGLDCSALVQTGLAAAGIACPRDSDMQAAGLGDDVSTSGPFRRGDLVFWKGHVGIMRDAETLLHANAFHMAVVSEPLAEAATRIAAREGGPILRAKRLGQ